MDGTTNRQHGLQADSLGFLVGQRRIERITGNIHQDTQEMVRLLRGMLQDRVLNPPDNQVQGLAAAIAISQRQATIDIVAAIRESSTNTQRLPIATRPTVDVGGSGAAAGTNPPPSTRTDYVRDARGRFVPRNRAGDADGAGGDDATAENTDGRVNNGRKRSANGQFEGGGGDSKSWFDKFKDAVSGGVSTGMADTQGVDPTVDAINELGGLLSPMKKAAGFAFKPISMLMKRNKRSEPLPADQERHNREERKFWGRLVDAVKAQTRSLSGMGGLGMLRMLPLVIPAAIAAAVAYLAENGDDLIDKGIEKVNALADESKTPDQGPVNSDGSSNVGVVGAVNRWAIGKVNAVRRVLGVEEKVIGQTEVERLASQQAQAAAAKPSYFIGDSIAKGYKDANRAPGDAVVGRSPKAVLEAVQLAAEKDLNMLKNSDVYLSSGLSNNPDDLASVEAQLKQLQAVGARVKLYGISNKFPKGDPKAMNASLEGLAAKYGATFLGGFDPSADNVHPRAYRPLASTPRPARNGRAPRNASAYDQIMREEYARAGFSPDEMAILKGQVHVESGFNPLAKSPMNAEGLSQFIPATARRYDVQYGDSPTAIRSQLAGQAKYMNYLLNRYNGDWEKALSGYNAGEGNTDSYIKAANRTGRDWKSYLRTETRNYLQQVPERAKLYRGLAQSVPADVAPTVAATTTTPEPTTPVPIVPATPEPVPVPADTAPVPVPAPIPASNTQSMIMPAARVMSLPISASSARQAPNLPAMQPMPKVKEQVSSPAPQVVTIAQSADTISQNVGDRAIAHAVTGGLGMRGWDQG